jgi:hypothetical protein
VPLDFLSVLRQGRRDPLIDLQIQAFQARAQQNFYQFLRHCALPYFFSKEQSDSRISDPLYQLVSSSAPLCEKQVQVPVKMQITRLLAIDENQ